MDHTVLTDAECPTVFTWVELALRSQENKWKLRKLLDSSGQVSVVIEDEFYGPPLPDPKLPEAIKSHYHPGWGHLAAFPAKLVVYRIDSVSTATEEPQLKLRVVVEKDIYALNEPVMVKSELTNLTSKTLCFPVPDQDCETTAVGSIITTGEPVKSEQVDVFICHADGGGTSEAQLESEIKNRWIKLPPNAVYTTKLAEAKASLNQLGDWRLSASYHPPVGAFSRDYVTTLQSAAERMGCQLPDSTAVAEPRIISVLPANPDR